MNLEQLTSRAARLAAERLASDSAHIPLIESEVSNAIQEAAEEQGESVYLRSMTKEYLDQLKAKIEALPESRTITLPVGMTLEGFMANLSFIDQEVVDLLSECAEAIDKEFWNLL